MKNKILLMLTLMFLATANIFAAEPFTGCYINVLRTDDPRCPKKYTVIRQVLNDFYEVTCTRVLPANGFIEAERKSIGYNKTMYCLESLLAYNQNCVYSCQWVLIGGNHTFNANEYLTFPILKIGPYETPCSECCSDL